MNTTLPDSFKKPLFIALILSQQIFNAIWYLGVYSVTDMLYIAANTVYMAALLLIVINYGFLPAAIGAAVARIPVMPLIQMGFTEQLLHSTLIWAAEAALLVLVIILVSRLLGFRDIIGRIVMFAALSFFMFLSAIYLYPVLAVLVAFLKETLNSQSTLLLRSSLEDIFSTFSEQVKETLNSDLSIHLKFNLLPNAVAVFAASAIQKRRGLQEERY